MSGNARYLIQLGIFTALIFVIFCLLRPGGFLSIDNLSSMAYQFPEFAILALAMHPTMLTGGIDLSVVSVANLCGILAAFTMRGAPPQFMLVAAAVALLVGTLCGIFNGVLVATFRLPAIVATLGTMQLFAGISIILTKGSSVTGIPSGYANVGNGSVLGIPIPLLIFVFTLVIIQVVTVRSPLGKQMRLYGTNSRAAPFAGIPIFRVLVLTYALSGITAACAGLVILSRANSANADYGTSYLLLSVLINILAGVNPNGGSGTVSGLVLAVLSLQFLSSGLNLLAVNNFARELLNGALLVTVMIANQLQGRIRSTRVRT